MQHRGRGRPWEAWHEQALFFRVIQAGKNRWNSAFWCGSPSIVRRAALQDIGGVATDDVGQHTRVAEGWLKRGWDGGCNTEPVRHGVVGAGPANYDAAGSKPEFVTCSGDQQVKMWNVDNGGNTRNFGGATDFLYAVGVSPDGAIVAAGGEEGVVRLYNGTNGTLVKALLPPGVEPAAPKK